MLHKRYKKMLSLSLTFTIAITMLSMTCSAVTIDSNASNAIYQTTQSITPYAEVTQYYYRTYLGRQQYRIWSVTYAKWLTDWIYI